MSTSLLPSVMYDFWCTCVFLRWRPPVGWSQVLLSCIEVDTRFLHGSREIFSPHLHEDHFVSKFVLWYLIFVRLFFRWPPPMGWSQILLSFVEIDTRFLYRRRETFPPYLHEDQFVFKCVLWFLMFVRFFFRWRPPVWWSQMPLRCVEVDMRSFFQALEKHFTLTCMRISPISCVCSLSYFRGLFLSGPSLLSILLATEWHATEIPNLVPHATAWQSAVPFFLCSISLAWDWFYSFLYSPSHVPWFIVIGIAPLLHVDTVFLLMRIFTVGKIFWDLFFSQ